MSSLFHILHSSVLLFISPPGLAGHSGPEHRHQEDARGSGQLHRVCSQPRVLSLHHGSLHACGHGAQPVQHRQDHCRHVRHAHGTLQVRGLASLNLRIWHSTMSHRLLHQAAGAIRPGFFYLSVVLHNCLFTTLALSKA